VDGGERREADRRGECPDTKAIAKLYDDPKVLPSIALDKYEAILS